MLSNGKGGVNYEPVEVSPDFDKAKSLAAFEATLYKHLRSSGCAGCHNNAVAEELGGHQAPLHSDDNVELAHEYALTRVNFKDPVNSKFVVRLQIDRHNCPGTGTCADAAKVMLKAVEDWKARIADQLPETPRSVPAGTKVAEADVKQWIANDKAKVAEADKKYMVYTSMHELHNEGLTADQLNIVRAGLSKALNSTARWAPEIVNPTDINGKALVYRIDIRDYWGYNQGVKELFFGGSDDDLAFGNGKKDYKGTAVTASVQQKKYNFTGKTVKDPEHALRIWERILHGNVEGAVTSGTIPPYIDGFKGTRKTNAAGDYVDINAFEWVETAQLVYTITRPDVYNAIMMLPFFADEIEANLQIDNSKGMDSYDYVAQLDAITVDSRLLFRAKRKSNPSKDFYWKSFDIFSGQISTGTGGDIRKVYADPTGKDIRFPWWANPIPKFVLWNTSADDNKFFSHLASLNQAFSGAGSGQFIASTTPGCDPADSYAGSSFKNCRHYTGKGGFMQSAAEVIFNLPNGLNGYYLTGGTNQRRVDAFNLIVRDPRILTKAGDNIAYALQYSSGFNVNDPRLNIGSSCIGCHADGMNRMNNDMRLWLDKAKDRLPKGKYGVDGWINDAATVKRVKELYKENSYIKETLEKDRQIFLTSMADIKEAMILGDDKNVYVEPIIWTVEYVQRTKYKYKQTTSN
ncbi:MAG: hypothetical protein RL497_516 [Pseudomonadota bacterium]